MNNINRLGLLSSLLGIINNNADEDSSDVVLAKYFLNNFNRLPEMNIYDVAEECFVTRAAIRRFCQYLGYDNYKDLKSQFIDMNNRYLFYKEINVDDHYPDTLSSDLHQMTIDCNNNIASHAYYIADILNEAEQIVFLVSDIYSKQCEEFQKGMIIYGKMVRIISQKYEDNKLLSSLKDHDVVFVISVGGMFAINLINLVSGIKCNKLLLTSNHNEELKEIYDHTLYLCSDNLGQDYTVYHKYATQYCLDLLMFAYKKKYVKS